MAPAPLFPVSRWISQSLSGRGRPGTGSQATCGVSSLQSFCETACLPDPGLKTVSPFSEASLQSRGPGAVSMIRKSHEWVLSGCWAHLKGGGRRGRRGGAIQEGTVSFYQDNEAKEVDLKGEYSSNGRKSVSKSGEAGAPRAGRE